MASSLLAGFASALVKGAGSLFRPRYGARGSIAPLAMPGAAGSMPLAWGRGWTEDPFEQVRHFTAWTYVAISRIMTAAAASPPNVSFSRDPADPKRIGNRTKWLPEHARAKAITPLQSHEQLEPVRWDHPLQRLLHDPNDPDTGSDLIEELVMYLLLTGDAYLWAPPSGPFRVPSALWVLPTHWIRPRAGQSGLVEQYDLCPLEGGYARMSIPADDVIHLRKKSPLSKNEGYSPAQAGARWIDGSESIDKSRWHSFRNGIMPGVAVEFQEGKLLPDEKDLDRIETRLMARYSGEHNAAKPLFIPPGAKIQKLHLTPQELDFHHSAEQLRDSILALFGVPPAIALVGHGAGHGATAAQASFCMLTLNPLLRFLGQQLTEKLAWRFDRHLKVWWEDRTPRDPEILEKQIATDSMVGAITANEVRGLRGRAPYPDSWANEPWIPLNTLPVSRALEYHSERPGSPGKNKATQGEASNVASGEERSDKK